MRGQRGQTAVEYLGGLLVVSVVIAAVATSHVGATIRHQLGVKVCAIGGGACADTVAPLRGGRALARAASAKPPKQTFHGVPLMPKPPPLQPGDGGNSGTWGTKKAGVWGRVKKQLAYGLADAAEAKGYEDAARDLRHYLANRGDVLNVDPRRLLRDIEALRDGAASMRVQLIQGLQKQLQKTYDGTTTYAYNYGMPWDSVLSNESVVGANWFFAMGGFSYTYTARATARPNPGGGDPVVTIEYRLHVFDRYNWDTGKSVSIGGVTVGDGVLGDLNKRGIAKNYEIHGTTAVDSVTVGLHQHVTAPPPATPAPSRSGGRTDPGRDRDGRGR